MSNQTLRLTRNDIAAIVGNDQRLIKAFENLFKASGGAAWVNIDFTDSNLTDILTRNHSDLQNVEVADDTDTDTTKDKHVSNAQLKVYKDHVDIIAGNPHGTNHNQLIGVLQADETSADTTKDKHVSNNQLKVVYDDIDALQVRQKSNEVLLWLSM